MDASAMRDYCLTKPGAWVDWPWGSEAEDDHPVVKVGPEDAGKIFAFLGTDGIGVKAGATREVADEWLQRYPADASVMAYIGRSGWNDLAFSGSIPDDELEDAVDESYRLVVSKLPKRHRPPGWDGSARGGPVVPTPQLPAAIPLLPALELPDLVLDQVLAAELDPSGVQGGRG
jgi:predicted DNA-binding protein (MmcQ/YjbR family)